MPEYDIAQELALLHVLEGAEFVRQLKNIIQFSIFKPVDGENDIFMADVQEIGYKRTTRTVKERKNELFRQNELGSILVDDGLEVTVLDMLRKISWD